MEEEKKRWYYEIKKEEDGEWEDASQGYYSFSRGVWGNIVRNKRKHADYKKRIIIRVGSEVKNIIELKNSDIEFYHDHKLQYYDVKEEDLGGEKYKYYYAFEIQIGKEIDEGTTILEWRNPLNSFFHNSLLAWHYIVRNKEVFSKYERRLKTISRETGEDLFSVEVTDSFISMMESTAVMREKI
jgi:hypothetical protein